MNDDRKSPSTLYLVATAVVAFVVVPFGSGIAMEAGVMDEHLMPSIMLLVLGLGFHISHAAAMGPLTLSYHAIRIMRLLVIAAACFVINKLINQLLA